MKKTLLASLLFASTAMAPAFANDVEEACNAYAEENGTDNSGCSCLGEAAADDADLTAAIMAISGPADIEAADDATKEAIGACFPQT